MPELFTWLVLASAAGTIAAATIVATIVKLMAPGVSASVLRYFILGTCLVVQGVASALSGPLTPQSVLVGGTNALVLALAAMGGYEKLRHGWSAEVTTTL